MYRTLICSPDSSTWMKPATSLRTTDRGRISTVCLRVATSRRSEEHTSELQSPCNLVCRLLLEKKKKNVYTHHNTICHDHFVNAPYPDTTRLSQSIATSDSIPYHQQCYTHPSTSITYISPSYPT